MSKIACVCGYLHNLIDNARDTGWGAVRESDYEAYVDAEVLRSRLGGAEEGSKEWDQMIDADVAVYKMKTDIYDCPNCGRLIWDRGEGEPTRIYKLEEERNP